MELKFDPDSKKIKCRACGHPTDLSEPLLMVLTADVTCKKCAAVVIKKQGHVLGPHGRDPGDEDKNAWGFLTD